eukprot:649075-Pleurochrysis_carterae.AAC.1
MHSCACACIPVRVHAFLCVCVRPRAPAALARPSARACDAMSDCCAWCTAEPKRCARKSAEAAVASDNFVGSAREPH